MVEGVIPLVGTIQVKLPNYFNTFQADFFGLSLKFVKKRFLKTLRSHLRSHFQSSKQRQKASRVSAHLSLPQGLFPHLISSVAPFRWIYAITLTADKNSEYRWQTNPRLALNEQLVAYTPSFKTSMPKFALEKLR